MILLSHVRQASFCKFIRSIISSNLNSRISSNFESLTVFLHFLSTISALEIKSEHKKGIGERAVLAPELASEPIGSGDAEKLSSLVLVYL